MRTPFTRGVLLTGAGGAFVLRFGLAAPAGSFEALLDGAFVADGCAAGGVADFDALAGGANDGGVGSG